MQVYARGLCVVLAVLAGCDDDEGTILLDVDNISVSTLEDTPLAGRVPVQANRAVTGRVVTPPSHGTLTTGPNGFFEYAPEANYSGPDTIALEFFAAGKMATGTVNITVTPVDDAPAPAPDSFAAGFATSIDIAHATLLANDQDIDSTNLTVSAVLPGSNGTVTMGTTNVTFRPAAGFEGVATFSYRVSDGTSTVEANVAVNVGVNQPPLAGPDTSTTSEDAPVTLTAAALLANDTDADQNTLVITNVSNATNGTVALANNIVTFTPAPNFTGTATFAYVVSDGATGTTGTVSIQVTPIMDAPTGIADALTTPEDQALTVQAALLAANDTDADGNALTVTAVSNASNGSVALAGGSVGFTPAVNFVGVAGFDYTVSDGTLTAVVHVTVTVTPINDAPTTVTDLATGNEDVPVVLDPATLLANDSDPEGDALTFLTVGNPVNGVVTIVATGIQFIAPANYNGPASFEYTVTDGALSSVGTVSLTILPVNDGPATVADAATTNEDVAVMISPLVNDVDLEGDAFSVVAVGTPGHGTATFANNVVTYTPAANYVGPDSFTYSAGDAGGAVSMGTISITVLPVADLPTASPDSFSVVEDTSTLLDVLANDFDVDGETVSLVIAGVPAHGTTSVVSGQVRYTPEANYFGPDTFTYVIADAGGSQGTGVVSITVTPVNDAPVGVADFYTANDEVTITVTAANGVLANDLDEGALTVNLLSSPTYGVLVLAADGSFTYTPDGCVDEDTFTYQAVDTSALTSTVTTVTIDLNHAPTGRPDFYTTTEATQIIVGADCNQNVRGVLCNDFDVDFDPLTATLTSQPNLGQITFQGDGSFVYEPNASVSDASDEFTYTVSDGVLSKLVSVDIYIYDSGCGSACALPTVAGQGAASAVATRDTEAGPESLAGETVPIGGQKCCLSRTVPQQISYCAIVEEDF